MNFTDIKKLSVRNQLDKVSRRIRKNETIAEFYEQLADDVNENRIAGRSTPEALMETGKRIKSCCQYWSIDYYHLQGVKDMLRTNACKNRFCDNCQNAISIKRERKLAPLLDHLAKRFDIYHIVFTVPNVYADELKPCIDKMYKQFAYINRLFNGDAKIKGISFSKYGYIGGIRALEITKNREENTFHPHLHCLLVLKKGLKLDSSKKHINRFSFNNPDVKKSHHKKEYGAPERYFSDFEILLQKVWKLRYDGTKLTKENIEKIHEGYSVIVENAKGHYKEIFKYATKGIFKEGENNAMGNYYDFLSLYYALHGRRLIQGYGVLNGVDFEELNQDADELYKSIQCKLKELEEPKFRCESLNEIENNVDKYTYISRSSITELLGEDYNT